MGDKIREPFGANDIKGIREKYGDIFANSMRRKNEEEKSAELRFIKKMIERFSSSADKKTKKKLLEAYLDYLKAVNYKLSEYYKIITINKPLFSLNDKTKKTNKKIQQLNDILIKPLDEILRALEQGSSDEEKNIQLIDWITFRLFDEVFPSQNNSYINEFFSNDEKALLEKNLRKIRKLASSLKCPSDISFATFNDLIKRLQKKSRDIETIIDAYIYKRMMDLLLAIKYEDFYDEEISKKIMKDSEEKYSLLKIGEQDREKSFVERYNGLKEYTKKQFGIDNINIEKYKKLLIKKEILKRIDKGLKEILSIINNNTFWNNENREIIQTLKSLIANFLPTITRMINENNKKIAEFEQYKEAVSKAYLVETQLIDELAEILFNIKIGKKYDKNRYEELVLIVKDENFKKAQERAEELYQDHRNKKAIEEMEQRLDYTSYNEYSYLYLQPTNHLEEELRYLAGEDAVRFAKERAEMAANNNFPVIPDHHREPFDSSPDENAGKRSKAREEYYRKNLIEKIIEIKEKQKEQEAQEMLKNNDSNNQPSIVEKELLELVGEILSKVTDESPYADYIYRTEEYPKYLPNINIKAITRNYKYLECIFTFLGPNEIKMVEADLKRRIADYLDLYYNSIPGAYTHTAPRELIEQQMQKELFLVACVEKVREKYIELTKGYSNN